MAESAIFMFRRPAVAATTGIRAEGLRAGYRIVHPI